MATLISKEYVYMVHYIKTPKVGLCKLEIKEKHDYARFVNRNYYLLSRNGIIEYYKLKCMNSTHRVKLVFSINTLSNKVTNILSIGKFKFSNCKNSIK